MTTLVREARYRANNLDRRKSVFRNEAGAIDLASVMVGIIVIGLIGGVIAATVFVVIPWAQDNAAKQQLESISSAQAAYKGLSSDPANLPVGVQPNSYANSPELEAAKLLTSGITYCTAKTPDNGYVAYSKSASGKIFTSTDRKTKPEILTGNTVPECSSLQEGTDNGGESPDNGGGSPDNGGGAAQQVTKLTYKCSPEIAGYLGGKVTGLIPMAGNLTGTETWSDGTTRTYNGAAQSELKELLPNIEYTLTFTGTYSKFDSHFRPQEDTLTLVWCLQSMEQWGSDTGVTDASFAFAGTDFLTDVPAQIPSSITNMDYMFYGSSITDPDIGKWNTSNVTSMSYMFSMMPQFSVPLNTWDVSKVKNMSGMFSMSYFNEPLNSWNTANVTNMNGMFTGSRFNQPLNNWNTSKVTDMSGMFAYSNYANDLSMWDTSSLVNGTQFAKPDVFNPNHLPARTSF